MIIKLRVLELEASVTKFFLTLEKRQTIQKKLKL